MNKPGHILFFFLSLFFWTTSEILAQNNLSVAYSNLNTLPDFLNICGDTDQIAVTVSLDGSSPLTRSNILAGLNFFKGVELVEFDINQSSNGVILTNSNNPNQPEFILPDLSPTGTTSIQIWMTIKANCEYVDTLLQNDQIQVFDNWSFSYDLGSNTGLSEQDITSEYRDAFAVPFFTMDIENDNPPARVNDCFDREIKISNSALDGFVDSLTYTNIQGSGIWVQDLQVNGISIDVTKTLDSNGDTIITAIIDAPYFQANQFGDGDGFFDPNEALTVLESYCLVNCNGFTGSTHKTSWGCSGEFCLENSQSDFVEIGEGAANVDVKTFGSLPNEFAGYCELGQTTVTFTNGGVEFDDGFASMLDIEAGIGLGNLFQLNHSGFSITNVRIAGIDLTAFDAFNLLHGNPQFSSDPDGIGGLSDEDGDGYFDDLAINESFEITVFYEFDCSNANLLDTNANCENNFSTSFNARIDYTNACQERLIRLQSNFFRPANTSSSVENTSDADAFVEGGVFFVNFDQTRSIRFFEHTCNGDEIFNVKVVLPQGITPSIDQTVLLKNDFTSIEMLSSSQSNDTLSLVFDASFSPFLNGDYNLKLALEADCSASLGKTNLPVLFAFECPPCNCEHVWYCGELEGPQLHATSPPCPPDIFECNIGLQTTSFEVDRTTFGFQDPLFQEPFDKELANKKVAISCDSVEMKVMNIVGETPIFDSIGVTITYSNPDLTNSPEEIFIFESGQVRFTNNGSEFFCDVTSNDLILETDTSFKRLTFDLNECLINLGLTLTENDTIEFIGQFSVNPTGPFSVQFKEVPDFRAFGFYIENGLKESCDNFGEIFTLAKNQIAFDFPNSNNFPQGCEETTLQYRLIIVNNGFSNFFGDELRPSSRVDSIIFDFDPNILTAFDQSNVDVSIPGHPLFGNDFFDLPPLSDFPDGKYSASFDTLLSAPTLNEVQTYTFNLRVHLIPNCSAVVSSQKDDNLYNFDATIFYQDRYYASFIGDGSCMVPEVDSVNSIIAYEDPPTFSLTPLSNTNFTLEGDTAVWTVQHCNNSFVSDAGLTWISIEDTSGTVQIVSIEDITDSNNPINLSFQNFGNSSSKSFAYTGSLLQANGTNSLEEICNFIRIKAIANQCLNANFAVRTGWNCQPYGDPNWTPEDYHPCQEVTQDLSLTILDPFLDANVTDQPSENPEICDTSSITILLRNIDRGVAFDVQTQIILPIQGATLIPGSFEFAYPSGSNFEPALGDPSFMNTTLQGQVFQYDDFSLISDFLNDNGLAGFNPSNPTDSNEVKMRFAFETDCNFRSGDLAFYNFKGLKGCGAETNFESGESFPLVINGAEPDLTKVFEIAFSPQSFVVSNANTTIEISVKNLTNTPSSTDDKISLSLPPNFNYISATSSTIIPANWQITDPTIEMPANFQMLTWSMPAGLGLNEEAVFSFEVQSPSFNCDTEDFQVELVTTTNNELYCESADINCTVQTITSTNGPALTILPIGQEIMVGFQNLVSSCSNANMELLQGQITLTSLNNLLNDNYSLMIFVDENQNGQIDSNETIVNQQQFSVSLEAGVSMSVDLSFEVEGAQICNLIAQLTAENLDLCEGVTMSLPIPDMQNAGLSQIICVPTDTVFTTQLGDTNCSSSNEYDFTWAAIPPALTSDLSNFKESNPTLTINYQGTGVDTLTYILATQRPNCGLTSIDTVSIILTPQIDISPNQPIVLIVGLDTVLTPNFTGGVAPYSYSWSPSDFLNDPLSTNPTANPDTDTNYSVTISDSNGCEDNTLFEIQVITPVNAVVSPQDTMICEGENIQFSASGGDNYLWVEHSNNPTSGNLNDLTIPNPIFTNGTPNGIYQFEVIVWLEDFPDFPDTANVVITVFESPTANAGNDINTCLGDQIQLEGSGFGGTASNDYSFNWSPQVLFGQGTATPIALPSETTLYTLTITDDNGCTSTDAILVSVEDCSCEPALILSVNTSAALCDLSVGTASIQPQGNISNYNYTWSPNVGDVQNFDNERINLPYGGYFVTVSDVSNPDCFVIVEFTIENEDGPLASVVTTPAACQATSGSATFSPNTLDYLWPDNQNSSSRNDLVPGTYFVTVTNPLVPDCPNVIEVEIGSNNPLTADFEILQNPDCGLANGEIQLNVNGGSGDYNFSWPSNTNIQDNLASGIYDITITDNDATGCEINLVFVLPDNVPMANVTITDTIDVSCAGANDGSVVFDVDYESGFVFPADTIYSNGYQTFQNGSFPTGNICVVINDGDGCLAGGACFEINETPSMLANLIASKACGNGGAIEVDVEGGIPPFSFDWQDIIGVDDPQNRTDLQEGFYELLISDQSGCSISVSTNVEPCDCENPIVTSIGITEAKCGISNGTAIITLNEPESNFTFNWTPNLGMTFGDGNIKENLPAGGYSVEIINNENPTCVVVTNFIITNEDGPFAEIISTNLATCQSNNGEAILSPDSLIYTWSNQQIGSIQNDLLAGEYFVTVTDTIANCNNVILVEIESENPLEVDYIVEQQPDCDQANGAVQLTVNGGSGNYGFSWPSLTNIQTDLSAGIYNVTVTDLTNLCEFPLTFTLENELQNAQINILDTLSNTCFGSNNGGVSFQINYDNNFQFPADTLITNGLGSFQNGSLPAGNYCLEIIDANNCVNASTCFEILAPDPITISYLSNQGCEDAGMIDITVNGGTPPFQYFWENVPGNPNQEDQFNLSAGFYNLVIQDDNNCLFNLDSIEIDTCILCDVFPADSVNLQALNCDSTAQLCLQIQNDDFPKYVIKDNGQLYDGYFIHCDFDFFGVYTYATLPGLGQNGPYNVVNWNAGNQSYSGVFNTISDLVDSMNVWDVNGNWMLDSNGGPFIIGGVDGVNYEPMEVEVILSGQNTILGFNAQFTPTAFAIDLDLGFHEIIATDTITGCQDTIYATVVCTQPDSLNLVIEVLQMDTLCFNGLELVGDIDTLFNDCEDGSFVGYEIIEDSCVVFTGLIEGMETACIVVCDEFDICDTTYVNITVLPNYNITDTILLTQSVEVCFDMSGLNYLEDPIDTMMNLCPTLGFESVDFTLVDSTNCIIYEGLELGTDTACVQFCDVFGNCDEVNFFITVVPGEMYTDTIPVFGQPIKYSFETSTLTGTIIEIEDICPEKNGQEILYEIDTSELCITYWGIADGTDTICIRLMDDLGNVWLTNMGITAIETQTDLFCDTILINMDRQYCLDLSELGGDWETVEDLCPDEGTPNVEITQNMTDPICIDYIGRELGRDTACWVICDEFDICDTTYFCFDVVENFDPPNLQDDGIDTTTTNTPIVIDIKQNDTIYGNIQDVYILDPPLYGEAIIFLDCSAGYTPDDPFCERFDEFTYVICNEIGCDTATVVIWIECVELTVFNAISPNGDDVNDIFYISQIENFDHHVQIFNRWGNLVFESRDYRNNNINSWPGTFDNEKDLPDGTYYYLLEWIDDTGKTNVQRGFIELMR
jgi:gliding motility-associated-like protein